MSLFSQSLSSLLFGESYDLRDGRTHTRIQTQSYVVKDMHLDIYEYMHCTAALQVLIHESILHKFMC